MKDPVDKIINSYDPNAPLAEALTIPSSWYTDDRIFELEKQTVFSRSWHFVARVDQLLEAGNYVTAAGLLSDAVTTNMTKLGVAGGDITTYITAHATLTTTSVDAAIAQVAREEYYALYLNPEAFTVWRRTGIPVLPSITGGPMPRRLLYPQSELSYNSANTPSVTLYAPKIFWDK